MLHILSVGDNMSTVPTFEIPMDVLIMAQLPRILRGEEVDLTPYINVIVSSKIVDAIRASITLPTEFESIVDIMLFAEKMRAFTAAIRGETYEPAIDRIIELMVSLYMVNAISTAFGTSA